MQKTKMPRPSRPALIAAGVGLAVVAAVTVAIVTVRDDGSGTTSDMQPAAQISSLQQGCRQWLAQDPAKAASPAWCTGMADWMGEHMTDTGMAPRMMWGGPDQMRTTCRQWATADAPATGSANPADSCDAMVEWMNDHMGAWSGRGDWDSWMMHGPGMGR